MIKFFKYLIPILFLLYTPAYATNYYIDLASGNDTTGDGTAGNPWKTIDKCTTTRSAGDECRAAKTTITTLAGTLTFTNGSTSVATSNDLTAVVSAGDLVGKNTSTESWWSVASLNSTTITLNYQYWGKTGSGDAVTGYKITPVVASEEYDVNSSGTSGSLVKISGGWDLTGPTQDGITAFSSSYSNTIDSNGKDYFKIEKFIIRGTGSTGINIGISDGVEIDSTTILDTTSYDLYITSSSGLIISNSFLSGGTGHGIYATSGASPNLPISASNLIIYSKGTGSSDTGISLNGKYTGSIFSSCEIYNSYASNLYIGPESDFNLFIDCIFDTSRSGHSILSYSLGNKFYNCSSLNPSGTNKSFYASNYSNFFQGSLEDYGGNTGYESSYYPWITYCQTGQDCKQIFAQGEIIHDSSADARSGKAIKFSPTDSGYFLAQKVGTVKIPSASSDITLNAYLKDNLTFDGTVLFIVLMDGRYISRVSKTPTTSYVKESIIIDSSSLVANKYLDLYVFVSGTAGSAWIDDFSAEQ